MRDLIESAVGSDCILNTHGRYNVHGVTPEVIVAPRSAEEAAAILTLATNENIAVEFAGAGSRLNSGNKPRRIELVMTSARLKNIAEYEAADLVISAQSGVTLSRIADAVTPNNQFLALDPPVDDESTIGAVAANGTAGPLRFAHGTPRDQVLGLEIVTGDGRILHFGGKVVKNVAGYDVVRLLVGSRGTLGFITSVNLRLKPLPQVDRTVAISGDFAQIADAADAIFDAHLEPVAVEIVSGEVGARPTGSSSWTLLARVQGNEEAVTAAVAAIQRCAASAQVQQMDVPIWRDLNAREAFSPVVIRFANLRARLRETAATALRVAQETECINPRFAIHAGNGIVRLLADQIGDAAASQLHHERHAMENAGGSLIVERPSLNGLDAFGHSDGARLMTGIKKIFDPAGILGVGRFDI